MTERITDQDLLNLTKEQAEELYAKGSEVVVWALLTLRALARHKETAATQTTENREPDPSTPSAMIAPYAKPNHKPKNKRRGRKKGHPGTRRAAPTHVDRRQEHRLRVCPDCGGRVGRARAGRRRIIEDIDQTRPVTTEHLIHSHYCRRCKKRVEPKVTDALPQSTIGNRALTLSSWLHYGLGNTVSQITDVFGALFQFPISPGGLVHQWQRLGGILEPWHEQIGREARDGAVLHADETGWRVNGVTHWLWCFTSPRLTYYVIDPSRGSGVVKEFPGECYGGTLITDFYCAYNAVAADRRQVCLVHLLREMKKVSQYNEDPEWIGFNATLRRLLRHAITLSARADRDAPDYASKRRRIHERLAALCAPDYEDADCRRLAGRLIRHRDFMLTFLDDIAVAFDNNRAEREIRPAVIARKNSFHNTSAKGARTQSILMSVYRTLKLRGLDPIQSIAQALAHYISNGRLPPLPDT